MSLKPKERREVEKAQRMNRTTRAQQELLWRTALTEVEGWVTQSFRSEGRHHHSESVCWAGDLMWAGAGTTEDISPGVPRSVRPRPPLLLPSVTPPVSTQDLGHNRGLKDVCRGKWWTLLTQLPVTTRANCPARNLRPGPGCTCQVIP